MAAAPVLPSWKRAVLKVGSSLVAPDASGCSTRYTEAIARFITTSRAAGREVILVSSGAVAAGRSTQAGAPAPRTIPERQALAALGQPLLMQHWQALLEVPCAQLLLTYDDLYHRRRFVNAKNTLAELLAQGTVPIINENDTVAVEELKVGDNDNLSAHAAVLAEAEVLIICSDVDGLYTADPRTVPEAERLAVVAQVEATHYALAGGSRSAVGTGGMVTKLEAAEKATAQGIPTVIVNGTRADHLQALADGTSPGTLFRAAPSPISARRYWMLHAVPSRGRIWVDAGAAQALREDGASLLPAGVTGAEGPFRAGDAVEVVVPTGGEATVVAKGLAQYGIRDVQAIQGCQSYEVRDRLPEAHSTLVIHRDELVLLER